MANMITSLRLIGSLALIFVPAWSMPFYVFYLLCGVSDMIDGTVARMTGSASEFGSRLDSAADVLFVAVCLGKLLPVIDLPLGIAVWIGGIILLKIGNQAVSLYRTKRFAAVHSVLNKVTGFLVFLFPLICGGGRLFAYMIFCCLAATAAALEELFRIIMDSVNE